MLSWRMERDEGSEMVLLSASGRICGFERMSPSIAGVGGQIGSRYELADWEQANENDVVTSSRDTPECKKWHPPREGMVTCSTNATTFRDERRTGAGMVIQNHKGTVIKHRRLSWPGVWNSKEAESKGFCGGFEFGGK
ncbi:hypothetical protein LINPERPRIM_LOCUS17134 [Linum perenne]